MQILQRTLFTSAVHEGVKARAMERKGFLSDRCVLNRHTNMTIGRYNVLYERIVRIS